MILYKKVLTMVVSFFLLSISVVNIEIKKADDNNWVIDGDTVYVDDNNLYASATPHTLYSSGWVEFSFQSKQYDGDIDVIWGFPDDTKPTHPQIWKNYTHYYDGQREIENWGTITIYNITNYTNIGIEHYSEYHITLGNENNTYLFAVNTSDNDTIQYYAFSDYTALNSTTFRISGNYNTTEQYQYNQTFYDWKTWNADFQKVNLIYQNMSTWYLLEDVTIQKNHIYKVRVYIEIPFNGFDAVDDKYWWAFKPSSETLTQAINNNHFYALDPWYDSGWDYRKEITVSNKIDNYKTLITVNKSSGGDVDCEGHCNNDFSDIRFADAEGNLVPYWIESYTSGSTAEIWVNNTYNDETLYLYYGNSGASSASDGKETFEIFDDFSGTTRNSTLWDNSNDAPDWSNDGTLVCDNDDKVDAIIGLSGDIRLRGRTTCTDMDGDLLSIRGGSDDDWYRLNNNDGTGGSQYDIEDGVIRIDRKEDGLSAYAYDTGNLRTDTYRIYEIRYTSSSVVALQDGNTIETYTGLRIFSDTRYIHYRAWDSTQESAYTYDWVFMCPYTTGTEPSFSFGSEESRPTGSNSPPTIEQESPTGTDISRTPSLHVRVNDSDANTSTIYWKIDTDSNVNDTSFAHTNISILNQTAYYNITTPLEYATQYYVGVWANDTHDNTSKFYTFTTIDYTPDAPTLTPSTINSNSISLSFTDDDEADSTRIEWDSKNDDSWSPNDHNLTYNGSSSPQTHSSLSQGTTYYYKAWSWNATQGVWSEGTTVKSGTTRSVKWYSASFGGNITIEESIPAIDFEINTTTWIGGELGVGSFIQKNFTCWQNGSSDVDIIINVTTTNFTFVSYAAWDSGGYEQVCANFTNSTPIWNTEHNINPDNSSLLIQSFNGELDFGIRLWFPKSVSATATREDFEVKLYVSES